MYLVIRIGLSGRASTENTTLPWSSLQLARYEYEQSVSMTYMVNLKLGEQESERLKAASGAKVQIGKAGRFVGQQAVQLHGGMGMTDELNVGHYFKRLTMIDTQFGNVDHHLKRYSQAA